MPANEPHPVGSQAAGGSMFTLNHGILASGAAVRRLALALALTVALAAASLGAGTQSAQAHATCSVLEHSDWHVLTFWPHRDWHVYTGRTFLGQMYGTDGALYNKWTYNFRNQQHGQRYSGVCKFRAHG
jgi:hypothetical protein